MTSFPVLKLALTKSTPGNNLENLFVALGLSNVLFMIGIGANDYETVCYILGITITSKHT
jgi:hypothetical protein